MDPYLDIIQNNPSKKEWLKNIKKDNFINYFSQLDKDSRNYLEIYYIIIKKYYNKFLDSNDLIILDYIDKKIDHLLFISKDRLLNNNETKFLSALLSRLITYNQKVSKEKIAIYINNCYLNNITSGLSSNLVILLKYTFNYLDDYNKSNLKFYLKPSSLMEEAIAKLKVIEKKLFVSSDYYNCFIDDYDTLPLDEFYYLIVFQTVTLLHEYRHYMQFKLINKKVLTKIEERLKKEIVILFNNKEFYNIYGNSFLLEQDANNYAISNLDYFIKKLVPKEYYEESKKCVIENIKECFSDFDIKDLIDEEYKKYNIRKIR